MERPPSFVDETAAALGLRVVRPLTGGIFGATMVADDAGAEFVLKVQPDPGLAPTWATGAAMAERLRETGYPASVYRGTGHTDTAVWSLQEPLTGLVPERLDADLARQLVALARRHAIDSGLQRPWRDDAIKRASGWLDAAIDKGIADDDARTLAGALEVGANADLIETAIVHTDLHHRNCLVDNGTITGIFDWEIASPGDWRFDLVTLAFWSLVYPQAADADARELVLEAVHSECPNDVATLMFTCQALRTISMQSARHPERTGATAAHLVAIIPRLAAD